MTSLVPIPSAAVQEPAFTREFRAANDRMHRDMPIPCGGNADRDVAAGMIPHRQDAIGMAHIVLRNGSDPEMCASLVRTLPR